MYKFLPVISLSFFILLIVLMIIPNMAVEGKSSSDKLPSLTLQDIHLVKKLADHPEFLCPEYLQCFIGPKADLAPAVSFDNLHTHAPIVRTFWYNENGQSVSYKLERSTKDQSKCLARFTVSISDQDGLRPEHMDKLLGIKSLPSFDENAIPADVYAIKSHTEILIYQSPHLLDLCQLVVRYVGPPLPMPSAKDMQEAIDYGRKTAFDHHSNGNFDRASTLLNSHLQTNPHDAEAHLKLAETYRAKSCLNQSIQEYRIALSEAGNDSDLRTRCIQGLRALKVKSADTGPIINLPQPSKQKNKINSSNTLEVGF